MNTTRHAASMFAAALILMAAVSPAPAQQAVAIKKIVTSDQTVPGLSGVNFNQLKWLQSTSNGQILFQSTLAGAGISTANDLSYWLTDGTSFTTVIREGDPAPALGSGITIRDIFDVSLNDSATAQLHADVQGTGVSGASNEYFWTGTPGAYSIIARERLSISQATPDSFASFSVNALGDSGKSLIVGERTGESGNSLWLIGDGSLTRITPGVGGGRIYLTPTDDIISGGSTGVWMKSPGAPVQQILQPGDPAPGTEPGVQFANVNGIIDINKNGTVVMSAALQGPGVTVDNGYGIWRGRVGQMEKVARRGEQVPGQPAGVLWGASGNLVDLSENGRVAFLTSLPGNTDSTNDSGIAEGLPGDMRLIAREGEHASGTPLGVIYKSFFDPKISSDGRTSFLAFLSGPDTVTNDAAIWQYTPDDQILHLLVRVGDTLEVAPGDVRTISFLTFAEPLREMPNDVAFLASFTDGTRGIFTASVPIPEPTTTLLLACALLFCRYPRSSGGEWKQSRNQDQ